MRFLSYLVRLMIAYLKERKHTYKYRRYEGGDNAAL